MTDDAPTGRHETELEREDRHLSELLQEFRVVQTGVQVLFAFLLTVPFTQRFSILDREQRALYFATTMLAAVAVVLLLAPTAWHRALFEQRDRHHLVAVSHRLMIGGLACVGAATCGVVILIASVLYPGTATVLAASAVGLLALLLWLVLPWRRRRRC